MNISSKSYIFKFNEIVPFDANRKFPLSNIAKVKLENPDNKTKYEGIKKFIEEDESLAKKLKRCSHLNMNIPRWIEFKDYIGEDENAEDSEDDCDMQGNDSGHENRNGSRNRMDNVTRQIVDSKFENKFNTFLY